MSTPAALLKSIPLDRIPPGLRFSLAQCLEPIAAGGGEPSAGVARDLFDLCDRAEPWVGREAGLAALGHELLSARYPTELRRFACAWLTLFPTAETMSRLAAVALSSDEPAPLREQAIWSLGYRQARAQPAEVMWSDEAVAVADPALVTLAREATAAGAVPPSDLGLALRHVRAAELFEVFAGAPLAWGSAYEAFASPPLARALLDRLEELPGDHQLRAMRLAAATLGAEAIDGLLAAAERPVADALEPIFLALTFGGEALLPALEDRVAGFKSAELLRQRARWHLANPGVVPTTRALATARTTALIPGPERPAACARAADDLAALTAFARHPEHYLYTMWAAMVNGSGDPARARTLTAAHPDSRWAVKRLYLQDLAARGRAKQVIASAQQLEGVEEGALALAIWGRPFLALELAATSRLANPNVAAARVLALHRIGRPDLARRVMAEELPPAELVSLDVLPDFPGASEKWLLEHHPGVDPATTALVSGEDAVIALARPAPEDAEPDSHSFETALALERWLARPIDGATVYLAGNFPGDSKDRHAAAILERGGRLVDGPFPGTHYYVMGLTCPVTIVAQLERQGTRRIRNQELGLSW
jgi:hypothetical protein